jgi:hypothetical protein
MKKHDMEVQHMAMITPHCCRVSCPTLMATSAGVFAVDVDAAPAPSTEFELETRCRFGTSLNRYRLAIMKRTVTKEVTHPGL